MSKTYGIGEYEITGLPVAISALDLRWHFFEVLIATQDNWINDLVRVANVELLPPDLREKTETEMLFSYLSKESKLEHLSLCDKIIDTPLRKLSLYLAKKKRNLKRFIKSEKAEHPDKSLIEIDQVALQKLILDWKTIRADKQAKFFCESIEKWADEYNLREEWCLDFVLQFLIYFWAAIKNDEKFKKSELDFTRAQSYWAQYESLLQLALDESLHSLHMKIFTRDIDENELGEKIPNFHFKVKQVEYTTRWFPTINTRKFFFDETSDQFTNYYKGLKKLTESRDIDETTFRLGLEEYCDEIEQGTKTKEHQIIFKPHEVLASEGLIIHQDYWEPWKATREEFIEEFMIDLRQKYEKYKEISKDLHAVKTDDFKSKLAIYCNKVERLIKKYCRKTPAMYSDKKHFEWLVEFQVPPLKSYGQITEEQAVDDKISISGVKKAVSKLARAIGINLRKAPRTGRPRKHDGHKVDAKEESI